MSPNAGRALSTVERMHARTRTWTECVYCFFVRAAAAKVGVLRERPTGRWGDGEIVSTAHNGCKVAATQNMRS